MGTTVWTRTLAPCIKGRTEGERVGGRPGVKLKTEYQNVSVCLDIKVPR